MTLPASGEITLNDVNVELGNTGTDAITIGSADVRDLFGVASGEITMADGYGKSSVYEIANSCRFNNDSYLERTPSSSSSSANRRKFTWSGWVKKSDTEGHNGIFERSETASTTYSIFMFHSTNDDFRVVEKQGGATKWDLITTVKFRDPSAWYHILVVVDTTQATASNRVKIYINGEQITDFDTETYPSQNYESLINTNSVHKVGKGSGLNLDGYLAEVNLIDGTALTASSFGETGDYGEWKPKSYSGSYGTNGFYLDFADSGDLGDDESGNGNDWTENSLSATDQMLDTPTNNFCTLNPIARVANNTSAVLSEGNLKIVSSNYFSYGTMAVSTGKWYFEAYVGSSNGGSIGITRTDVNHHDGGHYYDPGWFKDGWGYYKDGRKYRETSYITYGNSFTTGDIVGCAVDLDNAKVWFSKNGTWQASGNPVSGTNYAWNNVTYEVTPKLGTHSDGGSYEVANFGQDSSFAGNKTAQGNQDSNSIGDFYYTPPTDFLALCTSNLPDVAVIPSEHFNIITRAGSSSASSITGVGFQPDFIWTKTRSATDSHILYDAVRGTSNLKSDTNGIEALPAITSYDSDGFTYPGNTGVINYNGRTYVDWCWKADGSGSSNTDGSITSTVSANADAGFSIAAFTGTGSNATVGHGLSSAPEMVMVKNRGVSNDWHVYVEPLGATDVMILNLNYAKSSTANAFNSTAPTSTVFSVGSNGGTNQSSTAMVAYCFHSVDGYSKVGSYIGNGNVDGTFVYTGFRPAYILVKKTDAAESWVVIDNARHPYNDVNTPRVIPNTSAAESEDASIYVDYLSNGFKIRSTQNMMNNTSDNYIYLAFAETPFKYTNAR